MRGVERQLEGSRAMLQKEREESMEVQSAQQRRIEELQSEVGNKERTLTWAGQQATRLVQQQGGAERIDEFYSFTQ